MGSATRGATLIRAIGGTSVLAAIVTTAVLRPTRSLPRPLLAPASRSALSPTGRRTLAGTALGPTVLSTAGR
jgi:hypothetical protein